METSFRENLIIFDKLAYGTPLSELVDVRDLSRVFLLLVSNRFSSLNAYDLVLCHFWILLWSASWLSSGLLLHPDTV